MTAYWDLCTLKTRLKMEQSYRDEMREKLILATINRLETSGISGVHARDLASEVGCAVGTIYNLVGDLDNLILLACARTLEDIGCM